MKLFALQLLLVASVLLTACKKAPTQEVDVWIPTALKELFLFYPGTYWVFEELNSGFQDSIFVSKTVLDTIPIIHPGSKTVIGQKERFIVTCISPFYGIEFEIATESPDFAYTLGPNAPRHFIAQRHIREGKVVLRNLIYFYPEEKGKSHPIENDGLTFQTMKLDSIWPSFTLADNQYTQVRKIQISQDPSLQNQASLRSIAPGVGIIQRKVDAMGWNWVVKRYNVVR
jgi:hypothetical protein